MLVGCAKWVSIVGFALGLAACADAADDAEPASQPLTADERPWATVFRDFPSAAPDTSKVKSWTLSVVRGDSGKYLVAQGTPVDPTGARGAIEVVAKKGSDEIGIRDSDGQPISYLDEPTREAIGADMRAMNDEFVHRCMQGDEAAVQAADMLQHLAFTWNDAIIVVRIDFRPPPTGAAAAAALCRLDYGMAAPL